MKKRYCPLLLLVISFYACGDHRQVVAQLSSPDYEKAKSFLSRQPDSAFYYFNKIATGSKDSLQIAIAFSNMALIQADRGDYYGSQESLLSSLKYLNQQRQDNYNCLVADYNQLGRNSSDLKNYDAAIGYYDLALKFSDDERFKAIALNNKAVAYRKMRKYDQAIAIYGSIFSQSKSIKKEYARVLTNLAMVRWLRDPAYRAAPDLLTALKLRKAENDDWGLNSSYAHLADYYASSRPDSALFYAGNMYAVARRLGSPDDELEALQKLILFGAPGEVKKYFTQYQQLSDSVQTARNSAKNQFALIRYEAEKNKADNLRLQQENDEKKAEVVQQRAISAVVMAAFVVLTGAGIWWYRKRKQRLEWEKESAKQEERLQISRKVHDVVANGIYRLLTAVEHGGNIEREKLLDQLDGLYIQSRDISYEPAGSPRGDFQLSVGNILLPYGAAGRKVLIAGNEESIWKGVGLKITKELEPILQELMVNMDKHSGARNVVIRFDREGKGLIVQYMDDGIGFPAGCHFGNGLTNTENRIAAMSGRISFERNIPTGVKIRIYFPNA